MVGLQKKYGTPSGNPPAYGLRPSHALRRGPLPFMVTGDQRFQEGVPYFFSNLLTRPRS